MPILTFRFAWLLALGLVPLSALAQSSFYGGDPDLVEALGAEVNTFFPQQLTYDDFTLGTAGTVSQMYGNFLTDVVVSGLYYEIRSGVSEGDGGTLLYSGVIDKPKVEDSGDSLFGYGIYRVSGAPSGIVLQPGTYWLAVAVKDGGAGRGFVATTNGRNGVGGPLANGNSFFSSSLGDFFIPASLLVSDADFSMGINTRPVPEPTTFAVIGLGALALLRRRRI